MKTLTKEKQYTPEDLLRLKDRKRFELVDGKLVELNVSYWSSYVAGRIYLLLQVFSDAKKCGWVAPEGTSYQCFPDDPNRVRKPDTSFIKLNRLTLAQATTEGDMTVVPDLVVEVVSPRDTYEKVEQKTEEWVSAGVPLIWTVNPKARTVRVLKANQAEATYRENDEIDSDDVLPGFRCRVAEFFTTPIATT